MNMLDITTSHNIVVTVEPAEVSQRILATFIDIIIVSFYFMLVSLVTFNSERLAMILILPVFLCYHLIFEYFNEGQSLGKKALKIKVVSLTGERPKLLELVMRWMFRTVDVAITFGLLAIIFISSTKRKQRIGDILADTAVVKMENDRFISLDSILNLSDENYKVTYPMVTSYNDSDMLLVKEAIIRHQKKPTAANNRLIYSLCKKITKDFKIKEQSDAKRIDFLRTVINDYVVLTR